MSDLNSPIPTVYNLQHNVQSTTIDKTRGKENIPLTTKTPYSSIVSKSQKQPLALHLAAKAPQKINYNTVTNEDLNRVVRSLQANLEIKKFFREKERRSQVNSQSSIQQYKKQLKQHEQRLEQYKEQLKQYEEKLKKEKEKLQQHEQKLQQYEQQLNKKKEELEQHKEHERIQIELNDEKLLEERKNFFEELVEISKETISTIESCFVPEIESSIRDKEAIIVEYKQNIREFKEQMNSSPGIIAEIDKEISDLEIEIEKNLLRKNNFRFEFKLYFCK